MLILETRGILSLKNRVDNYIELMNNIQVIWLTNIRYSFHTVNIVTDLEFSIEKGRQDEILHETVLQSMNDLHLDCSLE